MSNNVKIIVYKSQRQGRKISFKKISSQYGKKEGKVFFCSGVFWELVVYFSV